MPEAPTPHRPTLRRFLVSSFDPGTTWRATPISQLRLATGDIEVRLQRRSNGSVTLSVGCGLGSQEHEAELKAFVGSALFEALQGSGDVPMLEKTRFRYPGSPWEVDVFTRAPYVGCVIAEVEMDSEGREPPPAPPGLVLHEEVTGRGEWAEQAMVSKPFPGRPWGAAPHPRCDRGIGYDG